VWGERAGPLLDRLELSVPAGVRLLLADRRGEQASALLRVLAGLLQPRHGTVTVAGHPAGAAGVAWRRQIGYVPAVPAFYPWLTHREALSLTARLQGLGGAAGRRAVAEALERFGVGSHADESLARASTAVRERCAYAAGRIHDPPILLLDQPLRSVDPFERRELLADPGPMRTIVLASRVPAADEGLCERVALLEGGRVTLEADMVTLAQRRLSLTFDTLERLRAREATGG
jgi:ABC-2 type transport system ATP-binding protein